MKPSLKIKIAGIEFPNPVLVASGTFGYGEEFEKFFPVKTLGGIVTKTITLKPRIGNPARRVFETPSGMLNAIGLQNVGAERFVQEKMTYFRRLKIPTIVSVMGYSVEEFVQVVERIDSVKGVHGFELNLSCPNVKYGTKSPKAVKMFAHDAKAIQQVVSKVRKVTSKCLIAKLGPDVSDIGMMAKASEAGGADAVSLINTLRAMAIDIRSKKPVLKNITGGLSGPCVKPIAVRMTWEASQAVKIPIIGMGGICSAEDAIEFFIAGASLIQVGTANFINPSVCVEIMKGVQEYLEKHRIKDIKDLVGSLNLS